MIARMEEAGLPVRHPHPTDGRASLFEPAAHGRALLERALQLHVPELAKDLFDPLTPVERLILQELVTKLLARSERGPVERPSSR
jgi:DNA-binding MarR family transcriptional regulator